MLCYRGGVQRISDTIALCSRAFIELGVVDSEEYERQDHFFVQLSDPIWAKKMSGIDFRLYQRRCFFFGSRRIQSQTVALPVDKQCSYSCRKPTPFRFLAPTTHLHLSINAHFHSLHCVNAR
jgi:hypothetical protein